MPKVEAAVSSVSQPKRPADQVKTLFDWQVVRPAPLKRAVKRLVDEAVVLKELVVVALVPVAFTKVKFWRVVEPTTRRLPDEFMVVEAAPPIAREFPVKTEAKRLVEVA